MPEFHHHGDLIIEPGSQGLTFAVATEPSLTFATPESKHKTWARWLAPLVFSLLLFARPSVSRAATYTAEELISRTNTVRVEQGLSALTSNAQLQAAAQAKANDMFAKNYFGHYSPAGTAPWTFFKAAGYSFTAAGENLAADYIDVGDIVPAWMSSKTHRDNLLSPTYRDIGIAVMDGTMNGSPTTVVVQFFGSRKSTTFPAVTTSTVTPKQTAQPVPAPAPMPTQTIVASAPQSQPTEIMPLFTTPAPIPTTQSLLATEQHPEIQGVATRVIPSLTMSQNHPTQLNLRITALVLSTLGLYATILATFGLMSGMVKRPENFTHATLDHVLG